MRMLHIGNAPKCFRQLSLDFLAPSVTSQRIELFWILALADDCCGSGNFGKPGRPTGVGNGRHPHVDPPIARGLAPSTADSDQPAKRAQSSGPSAKPPPRTKGPMTLWRSADYLSWVPSSIRCQASRTCSPEGMVVGCRGRGGHRSPGRIDRGRASHAAYRGTIAHSDRGKGV